VCVLRLCSLVFGSYVSLNKVLYKISLYEGKLFGKNKEASGVWRIKSNKELNDLIKNRNILNRFLIIFNFFADRSSQYIDQLHPLNFIMSLVYASTCFKHTFLPLGGQKCTIQSVVSSHM
jgi:hypothetical protein